MARRLPPHMRELEPKFGEATTALFANAFAAGAEVGHGPQGWTMMDVVEQSKRCKTLSEAKVLVDRVALAFFSLSGPREAAWFALVRCASD